MEPYSDRVTRCGDGKYRWVYEYPMLKNPTILLTALTLFLLCGLAPVGIVVLSGLSRGDRCPGQRLAGIWDPCSHSPSLDPDFLRHPGNELRLDVHCAV